jgi:hypothetical protein
VLELFLDHAHDDGGVKPLSSHVADHDPERVGVAMRQVEVAGEFAGRAGDRMQLDIARRLGGT